MKANPVTRNFIRYRLTDPVFGVDNWRAEAFGLLVAERFYPDLVVHFREAGRDDHGFFRRKLNQAWDHLGQRGRMVGGAVTGADIDEIDRRIPDSGKRGAADARAIAAGTICHHLIRFMQTGDKDDVANLASAAYAGVYVDTRADGDAGPSTWVNGIPFDEIGDYATAVEDSPGVRSELSLQDADLAFVEMLSGPQAGQFEAVLRRAFNGRPEHGTSAA